MVIDHASSVTFFFESLLHRRSIPLLNKFHVTLLFFICYRRRLRAGLTLPIFEQSLGFYHFFCVIVVSREEDVVLLFLQERLLSYWRTNIQLHNSLQNKSIVNFAHSSCFAVSITCSSKNPIHHHQSLPIIVIIF